MDEIPMSQDILPAERWQAGSDYLAALRRYGVEPEGMAWAVDGRLDFHLLIVTSLVDRVGPKAVYDVLFKAYDAAVTPKSIDPWSVTLHSPKTVVGSSYLNMPIVKLSDTSGRITHDMNKTVIEFEGLRVRANWVYIRSRPKFSPDRQIRSWDRFVREVEAVAA